MDVVLVAVGAAVAGGLGGLGVLVATVATPAKRFGRALAGLRATLEIKAEPLRGGLSRPR